MASNALFMSNVISSVVRGGHLELMQSCTFCVMSVNNVVEWCSL